jgi:hypothetical protein
MQLTEFIIHEASTSGVDVRGHIAALGLDFDYRMTVLESYIHPSENDSIYGPGCAEHFVIERFDDILAIMPEESDQLLLPFDPYWSIYDAIEDRIVELEPTLHEQ